MKRTEYCHVCKQQKVRKSRYFRTFLHLHYEPGESIYIPAGACYIRLAKQNRGQTASKLRAWCRLVTPDVSRAVPHSPFANQRSVCGWKARKNLVRCAPNRLRFGGISGILTSRLAPTRNPEPGGGELQGNVSTFYQGGNPMKKFLSLVLALVMTMSLVTVSCRCQGLHGQQQDQLR